MLKILEELKKNFDIGHNAELKVVNLDDIKAIIQKEIDNW